MAVCRHQKSSSHRKQADVRWAMAMKVKWSALAKRSCSDGKCSCLDRQQVGNIRCYVLYDCRDLCIYGRPKSIGHKRKCVKKKIVTSLNCLVVRVHSGQKSSQRADYRGRVLRMSSMSAIWNLDYAFQISSLAGIHVSMWIQTWIYKDKDRINITLIHLNYKNVDWRRKEPKVSRR